MSLKSETKLAMTNKDISTTTTTTTASTTTSNPTTLDDNSVKINDKKKKSFIPKIFSSKKTGRGLDDDIFNSDGDAVFVDIEKKLESRRKAFMEAAPMMRKSFSDRQTSPGIEGLNLSNFDQSMVPEDEIQRFRIFVANWNVGGKSPSNNLNLEDFLQVGGCADIYVCGFQEIVPLSAGNVLVIEDNEPAAKWLALINQALNRPQNDSDYSSSDLSTGTQRSNSSSSSNNSKDAKSPSSLNFFQKPSLKVLSKNFRADSSLLKACNCPLDSITRQKRRIRKLSDPSKIDTKSLRPQRNGRVEDLFLDAEESFSAAKQISYRLITSKKMVGIFLTIWARKDLVPYIAHLRVSSVGRGIMGCLGNKGCITISMSLHKTSFCFICSHLASGEKEGDELKRNADVIEILKCTQLPKLCKTPNPRAPEKIVDHDRVIWLGDLNYRVALSYEETRLLLEDNDWDALLEKDQLNMERGAGRIFNGFKEGKILFAPTYKYSQNSDCYAGETVKTKKKRRTPAWCDRILWRGNGIEQLSYIRGESRFSDHRPVCGVFSVEVEVEPTRNQIESKLRKGYSCAHPRLEYDQDCIPQRHSFYEY